MPIHPESKHMTRLTTVLSSHHGNVHVYTRRHIRGCQLLSTDDNHCWCPKWIYSKARGGPAKQKAANTGSLAEACLQAQQILRDFDPELRSARETTALAKKFKPDERALNPLAQARIRLVACLAVNPSVSEYAMTDDLKPGPSATFAARRGSLKSFWTTHRERIELEKQRVAALSKTERDIIEAESRQVIQDALGSHPARKQPLIH
jgi:hypothetical protein